MFAINRESQTENSNADCENSDDSNYDEDEDELTRIIPPTTEDTKKCMKTRYILGG